LFAKLECRAKVAEVSGYVVHTVILLEGEVMTELKKVKIISTIDARNDVNDDIHLATPDRCVRPWSSKSRLISLWAGELYYAHVQSSINIPRDAERKAFEQEPRFNSL
jgi:hypothetical protein